MALGRSWHSVTVGTQSSWHPVLLALSPVGTVSIGTQSSWHSVNWHSVPTPGGSGHDKSPETEFSRQRCPAWEKECTEVADNACCKYCDKPGHGKSPDAEVRKKKCPAWGEECSSCEKKGHFRKVCKKKDSANTTSIGLGRIACTEIGETACCRYYGKSGHGKEPGKELRKLRCPA